MYAFCQQTDKQTNRQTDGQPQRIKPQSRYRERRLNNVRDLHLMSHETKIKPVYRIYDTKAAARQSLNCIKNQKK